MLTAQLIKSPAPVKTQKSPREGATTLFVPFPWGRYVKLALLFGSATAFSHAEELDSAVPKIDLETYS
jgi:hypothetical protein